MPTSLVTGGAGFLGSHLCEALLAKGHRVICLDNLETGSLANIEHLRDDAFAFLHHDLSEPIEIDEPLDFVYHLAAPASPIDYLRLPLQTLKVGSYGTHNALGLAKVKRARFLLASTSEVYGDPQVHPQPETYWGHVNPIGPRGVYDEAKRYAEALTMAYHRQQGVDTAIVRIFNTYGPRMRPHDGRAIPTFIRQALEEKPLTVFGDGSQTRSFCYVDDLIRGLILLAESGEHLPVNIGNPGEFTILELAEAVVAATGSSEPDRLRGAAGRRPAGAPARHHARAAAPRLGAGDRARRGPAPHAGVARERPGACVGRAAVAVAARGRRSLLLAAGRVGVDAPCASAIFDDGEILYGEPDLVFPQLAEDRDAAAPRQPLVGRPRDPRRDPQAAAPRRPDRPGLQLGHVRPHGAVRDRQRDRSRSSRSSARRRGRTRPRAGTSRRRMRATCGPSRPRRRSATAARSSTQTASPCRA